VNNYPHESDLNKIKKWKFEKRQDVLDFLDFIQSIWEYGEPYFKITGKRVIKLQAHTGGWSGNEEILDAMRENFIFWSIAWQKSVKGGHCYFSIDLKCWRKI